MLLLITSIWGPVLFWRCFFQHFKLMCESLLCQGMQRRAKDCKEQNLGSGSISAWLFCPGPSDFFPGGYGKTKQIIAVLCCSQSVVCFCLTLSSLNYLPEGLNVTSNNSSSPRWPSQSWVVDFTSLIAWWSLLWECVSYTLGGHVNGF